MTDSTLEDQVRDELHRQAQRVVIPPPDLHAVATARHRFEDESPRWRQRVALVVVVALGAVTLGAVAMIRVSGDTASTDAASTRDSVFRFDTGVGVRLEADRFIVETGGRRFSPSSEAELSGDPGIRPGADQPGYTTLELTWFEHGVEMRVNLYFASDPDSWWVSEIRTYDGDDPGQWVTMTGEYLHSPLGEPFVGDLDVGPLHLGELRLEAFVPRVSSCDGSGPDGRLVLELAGPRPIQGQSAPGGVSGYATWFELLDAVTCTPVEPEGIRFEAVTGNPDIAAPSYVGPALDSNLGPGRVRTEVKFLGPGQTDLTLIAIDEATGNILAAIDVPVTVDEP
jgi:hypothetical protein